MSATRASTLQMLLRRYARRALCVCGNVTMVATLRRSRRAAPQGSLQMHMMGRRRRLSFFFFFGSVSSFFLRPAVKTFTKTWEEVYILIETILSILFEVNTELSKHGCGTTLPPLPG